MKVPKSINNFRRNLMQGLTKNIGRSDFKKLQIKSNFEVKRVLICRPNHRLGNLLLITPLIQELSATFPGCKIDVFIKGGLAPIVLKNYSEIDRLISLPRKPTKEPLQYFKVWLALKKHAYDLVINADTKSSSGRISAKIVSAKIKFFGDENDMDSTNKPDDYFHFAKHPIYNLRENLSMLGIPTLKGEMPYLDIKLSAVEISEGKKIVDNLVKNTKKTICIFTFATGKKCYTEAWWLPFYEKLVTAFPDYNIIEILPVENVSQIGFKATSFYSKDVREMAAVMRNTAIFIGADSGIMHLASASPTPTVGLFSVTKSNRYAPYNEGSIAVNTNETDADGIIKIVTSILSKS